MKTVVIIALVFIIILLGIGLIWILTKDKSSIPKKPLSELANYPDKPEVFGIWPDQSGFPYTTPDKLEQAFEFLNSRGFKLRKASRKDIEDVLKKDVQWCAGAFITDNQQDRIYPMQVGNVKGCSAFTSAMPAIFTLQSTLEPGKGGLTVFGIKPKEKYSKFTDGKNKYVILPYHTPSPNKPAKGETFVEDKTVKKWSQHDA